jgi:hypothetical protein
MKRMILPVASLMLGVLWIGGCGKDSSSEDKSAQKDVQMTEADSSCEEPRADLPTERVVYVADPETHQEFTLTVGMAEAAPFKNPETGEKTLYPWYFCHECKHRFLRSAHAATTQPASPHPIEAPQCPGCGSWDCGTWVKDIHGPETEGDIWPE